MSNYQISLNLEDMRKEAEKLFRDKSLETMKSQIAFLFREKSRWDPRSVDGPAYQMIQERLANEILSEKSQKIMDAYFSENWEKILHEAMDKAMRKAAEHKANQMAFAQAGLKNPREKISPEIEDNLNRGYEGYRSN